MSGRQPAAAPVTVGGITAELPPTGKVFYPDDKITKGEVIEYYQAIADRMLPYLRDRPLTMARCPDAGRHVLREHHRRHYDLAVLRRRLEEATARD